MIFFLIKINKKYEDVYLMAYMKKNKVSFIVINMNNSGMIMDYTWVRQLHKNM